MLAMSGNCRAFFVHRIERGREMNQAESRTETPKAQGPSAAIQQLRETHDHGGGSSAEEDAQRLASHIRGIDEEIDALSEERGKLAEALVKAAETSRMNCDKFVAIAKNDYRDFLGER